MREVQSQPRGDFSGRISPAEARLKFASRVLELTQGRQTGERRFDATHFVRTGEARRRINQ